MNRKRKSWFERRQKAWQRVVATHRSIREADERTRQLAEVAFVEGWNRATADANRGQRISKGTPCQPPTT